MQSHASSSMVRQIESLFEGSSVAGLSDRQLLDRFIARRDAAGEAAFAGLVFRHGPLVLGVCNELLGNRHDAEDAFQCVFLILAQKAHAIRDPDLLGNWLYGVALRTCRQASLSIARRRKHDEAAQTSNSGSIAVTPSVEQSLLVREQSELLHEEIERLPRTFRLPVVLCYLEGLTVHEAARRLRWSHGTLRSRMARAREKLSARPHPPRRRLTRRHPGRGPIRTLHVSISLIQPVRNNRACRDSVRRWSGRRAVGDGRGPAVAQIDLTPKGEVPRAIVPVARCRGDQC